MIMGIGIDVVDIEHMRSVLLHVPAFAEKTFSQREHALAAVRSDELLFFCTRFAAKEAILKALNFTGLDSARLREIEILSAEDGAPLVTFSGDLAEHMAKMHPNCIIHVSMTRGEKIVTAFTVAEKHE